MTNYKLIATDLDGTLLNSRGELSKENLLAMERLAERDIKIVLSTGRTLSEIPPELKNNPNVSYLIGSNGAAVWDLKRKEKIISLVFENSLSNEVFEILRRYKANITFRYKGESYVDKADWQGERYKLYNICEPHRKAVESFANFMEDFYGFSERLNEIETFAVFFSDKTEMEDCLSRLTKNSRLLVVRAWDYNLEIFTKASGKGNALAALSKMLNIPISETVAVGDSNNDTSMIERAGLGLCTSNGVATLKEKAQKIICSNDRHIMKYILENIIGAG